MLMIERVEALWIAEIDKCLDHRRRRPSLCRTREAIGCAVAACIEKEDERGTKGRRERGMRTVDQLGHAEGAVEVLEQMRAPRRSDATQKRDVVFVGVVARTHRAARATEEAGRPKPRRTLVIGLAAGERRIVAGVGVVVATDVSRSLRRGSTNRPRLDCLARNC